MLAVIIIEKRQRQMQEESQQSRGGGGSPGWAQDDDMTFEQFISMRIQKLKDKLTREYEENREAILKQVNSLTSYDINKLYDEVVHGYVKEQS